MEVTPEFIDEFNKTNTTGYKFMDITSESYKLTNTDRTVSITYYTKDKVSITSIINIIISTNRRDMIRKKIR